MKTRAIHKVVNTAITQHCELKVISLPIMLAIIVGTVQMSDRVFICLMRYICLVCASDG